MRLNKDVTQLLRTHGRDLTLTRTNSGGTYNTTTGAFGGGSTVTYTGRGVFINYVEEDIDGTTVQADDRKLLLQSATAPENGDRVSTEVTSNPTYSVLGGNVYLTIDGLEYTLTDVIGGGGSIQIIRTRTIESGSTIIGYICQVRG